MLLKQILFIYYLVEFKKNYISIKDPINFGSKINTITLIYVYKLDFKIRYTYIRAQRINNFIFIIFEKVLVSFQLSNKLGKSQFC